MFKVIVCDDEEKFRSQNISYLRTLMAEKHYEFSLFECVSGEELVALYPSVMADIILLDMMMDEANGIEAAKRVREMNEDVCILYISSYPQYALKSFEAKPFSFLTKPLVYSSFAYEMELAIRHIEKHAAHFLILKDNEEGTLRQLDCRKISYLESSDHLTFVHAQEVIPARKKLDDFEAELSPYGFIRCHKSYLVNHLFIRSVDKEFLTLEDGTKISISRAQRKKFLSALSSAIGEAP